MAHTHTQRIWKNNTFHLFPSGKFSIRAIFFHHISEPTSWAKCSVFTCNLYRSWIRCSCAFIIGMRVRACFFGCARCMFSFMLAVAFPCAVSGLVAGLRECACLCAAWTKIDALLMIAVQKPLAFDHSNKKGTPTKASASDSVLVSSVSQSTAKRILC